MGDNDNPLTFVENKDGTISVKDTEGKEIRYAKESDLLAIKGSSEAARKEAEKAQEAAKAETATASTNLETVRQEKLRAEATISDLEEKVKAGAGSTEELAKVKLELENANKSVEGLSSKALELRKTILTTTYGISAEVVKDKTLEQLDFFEEALKAVAAAKGIGNFAIAVPGGGGAPTTPIDRAKETIRIAMEKRGIKVED